MRIFRLAPPLALATTLALACAAPAPAAPTAPAAEPSTTKTSAADDKPLKFGFAPADGHECDQALKNTVTTTISGGQDKPAQREDRSDSVTHVRFAKTPAGYRITSKATSGEMTRDGKPVSDSITQMLVNQELTMEVGADGKATDVQGYDPIVKAILEKIPPEARARLEPVFNAKALRDKDIADWNAKVAAYVGKDLKVGDVWEKRDAIPMSAGPLEYTTLTRVAKIEQKDGRTLVTLEFAYGQDNAEARRWLDRSPQPAPVAAAPGEVDKPSVHGFATRVVDAASMDFLREDETRVITAPVQLPGKGPSKVERTEVRQYTLQCSK